jgi:hypothetical protein
LFEFGFQPLPWELQLDGDGGKADVPIEPRKQPASACGGFERIRDSGEIMTHDKLEL